MPRPPSILWSNSAGWNTPEPVRRVEVDLPAGAVALVAGAGPVSLAFEAPPDRVEARTNAGGVDLVVPDQGNAVDAGSSAGRTQVELVGDPTAPRRR